jgi:class 3 adenylate cyclase
MALSEDLESDVKAIFREAWTERNGTVVPNGDSMTLGNEGVNIEGTVLYADLSDSTPLVDTYARHFAAEIYKTFLRCAARIIRAQGGTIVAYDGDRVMAVFTGDNKNTSAIKAGLKINWAVKNIVRPAQAAQYPKNIYAVYHTVGIDTSPLMAINAGIRGSNDVAWIGKAANHAAKLCALSHDWPTWITKAVYDVASPEAKFTNGKSIWEAVNWTAMNNAPIYRSTWWWKP